MENLARDSSKMRRPLELALSAGQSQPERLPGLLAMLRQLTIELADELRSVIQRPPRIRLLDVTASTFSEFGRIQPSGICGVLWAEKWRQRVYCLAEPSAALLYLDSSLGCEEVSEPIPLVRPYSPTEIRILETLYKRLARALNNAVSIAVDVKFDVTHVVEKLDEELSCRPSTPIVAARFHLQWPGVSGIVTVIIPYAAIEPIREILMKGPAPEPIQDPDEAEMDWTRKLSDEIARSFTTLSAVLEERSISFNEIQQFVAGKTIALNCETLSTLRLDVQEQPSFWCELGKTGDDLCLRIERSFDPDEFANDEI